MLFNVIEVLIKDGNRTVSWEFPEDTKIADILAYWEQGYNKVDRDNVRINDKLLDGKLLECQLNYFKKIDRKVRIRVESAKKQADKGEAEG